MNFYLKLFLFFICFIPNLYADTITVKCTVDEEHTYSFILNKEEKKVNWIDNNNQEMIITIFPDVDKGGKLLIMGGTGKNNEKHTFIIDVVKSVASVTTNLGFNKSGKCGNKAIFEPPDPYAD